MPQSRLKKKTVSSEFQGFPTAGLRFLADLKKHNDRDWFKERKEIYDTQVHEPMEALVAALAGEFRSRKIPLFPKERNPVMRVYRDIRFSKNKTPYKTHVATELRRSFATEGGMLYLHISPAESFAAAGVWQPDRTQLQLWRQAMVDDPKAWNKVVADLKKKGLELSSEYALSVMPRGFQMHEALAPWLKLTSYVTSRPIPKPDCPGPDLVESILSFVEAARPLLDWSWRLEPKPKALD
jgi:uncharacterized protein (TIGR02453 family)